MIDELIDKAFKIAVKTSERYIDRNNKPYIIHLVQVSMNFDNASQKDYIITALLHDAVENSDITLDELKLYGFSIDVLEALEILIKNKDETYYDYVLRFAKNPIARDVKYFEFKYYKDISEENSVQYKLCDFYMSIIDAYKSIPDHSIFVYFKDPNLVEYLK